MFLHVDLDAFFASVEQLLNPALRGKPVIVAGIGRRGVVSAASYEARAFGVHSAMPTAAALQRCPQGVYISPQHRAYEQYSKLVMNILRDITPEVEPLSIDEAFMSVDGVRRLHGDARTVAALVRSRVLDEVGLTISVGVASTKFLAKIASDVSKPDGLFVVAEGSELEFLHPLPVRRLWGVGPKTLEKLERIGVESIGDLAALPLVALVHAVGEASGQHLHALAHNEDPRSVVTERDAKSIGNEETFAHDLRTRPEAERELLRLGDKVAGRLRHHKVAARVVSLKARYSDFTTVSRSRTLGEPTDQSTFIVTTARELLADIDVERGIRLLGIHCSRLELPVVEHQGAFDLGDGVGAPVHNARQEMIDRAVDEVRAKFGNAAVAPATLVAPRRERDRSGSSPQRHSGVTTEVNEEV